MPAASADRAGPHQQSREGNTTFLEELDAQRTLFSVEQAPVRLRADLLAVLMNLHAPWAAAGGRRLDNLD